MNFIWLYYSQGSTISVILNEFDETNKNTLGISSTSFYLFISDLMPTSTKHQLVTGQSGVNHQCPPLIFEVSKKSTVISPPQSLFLSAWLQEHLFLSAVRIWDVRENQCTIDWLVVPTMRNCFYSWMKLDLSPSKKQQSFTNVKGSANLW